MSNAKLITLESCNLVVTTGNYDVASFVRDDARLVVQELSSSELGAAGMRTFFRIAEEWRLSDGEQAAIMNLGADQLRSARTAEGAWMKDDTLERLSHVFGIFRAINTLLPNASRAAQWMRATNHAPIFNGRSAVQLISSGRIEDLSLVRRYLEAECQ